MLVFFIVSLLFILAKPAHAYLDPGTGSYITQVMIGLLVGSGYAIKVYRQKIIAWFRKIISSFRHHADKKDHL